MKKFKILILSLLISIGTFSADVNKDVPRYEHSSMFNEEKDHPLEIEDWMVNSKTFDEPIVIEQEDSLQIETWMLDSTLFGN